MKERVLSQEVLQTIANVLPDLTSGDHSIATMLKESFHLGFLDKKEAHSSDIMRIDGLHSDLGAFDLRLYKGHKDELGLQFELTSPGFENQSFFAWRGGNLNQGESELYGHLMSVVDFKFDFGKHQFLIDAHRQRYGTWGGTYNFGHTEEVNYNGKLIFSGFDVNDNIANLTITDPKINRPTSLSFPAEILKVDLKALPQIR
jgi:hypothetical protein